MLASDRSPSQAPAPAPAVGKAAAVAPPDGRDWVGLTSLPLPVEAANAWVTTPGSGAVVCFAGVVREHSDGRTGVRGLTYEAYEEQATRRLAEIAAELRRRWPDVERIALLHRLGDLALSEPSVVVIVSAPHRAEAFEAARFGIDTLKETVPIWKREHWEGGSGWAASASPARPVRPSTPTG
ncbi:MAG TPA: molybdenum cofactor biosynthesis protein MoaE [Acidimicrobiia bacterium]|nr:molybdenum cofactor biosynthesis protein MoaE [Acidimicrobiia bacterium]